MKNFSFKLLQQLNQKKADKGFTLIELLVVIIIIGILSAIALPAFLNQANKARQSEAKQALGAINRGQQAYYLERQGFADVIDNLGLGVASFTSNYNYGNANTAYAGTAALPSNTNQTFGGGAPQAKVKGGWASYSGVIATATNQAAVRDYVGITFIVPASGGLESTTRAILCEEKDLGANSLGVANVTAAFGGGDSCITGTASTVITPAGALQDIAQ